MNSNFSAVYKQRTGEINKRQTILKMARSCRLKAFTPYDISDMIKNATSEDVSPSLCRLVLDKYYERVDGSAFYKNN